jgi:hypothetical protein
VAPSIEDQELDGDPRDPEGGDADLEPALDLGPDPVIGAGVTLLGIFVMGVGGARDAHYLFDFGVLVAVLGAATFVLFVALSAMKQRRAASGDEEPPAA